jgi:predicted DCC family thiol-disulfide oxidoreductase YuxK
MGDRLTVYFDGSCPVCSREIGFYRARPGADGFDWVNVAAGGSEVEVLGPGLSRNAALARMHVRRADGTLLAGAAAFAEMWRHMPGFRLLGLVLSIPPVLAVAELGYRVFLMVRKLWR